jgi:hypothetical protein
VYAEIVNCKLTNDTTYAGVANKSIEVRSIMSTVTSLAVAVAVRQDRPFRPLAAVWGKFYRFLNQLPERYEPVDPEVLKRVPVPI